MTKNEILEYLSQYDDDTEIYLSIDDIQSDNSYVKKLDESDIEFEEVRGTKKLYFSQKVALKA